MDYIERFIHISNMYYNKGLEQAKVRDLSGAIVSLKDSLRYNKRNKDARNLLGLVYFEMGEFVEAVREWVISQSLTPKNNSADDYLHAVQSNENKFNALNQSIKKYNQALFYCRQGSKDLAILQLKKVLAVNGGMVKARQLLALLYIADEKYELAEAELEKAEKIDANNVCNLRYRKEIEGHLKKYRIPKKTVVEEKNNRVAYQNGNETIIQPAPVKESSAMGIILNLLIGVVIGALITCFLVFPTVKQNAVSEANKTVREANETISTRNQTIKTLENELEDLEKEVEKAKDDKSDSLEVLSVYEQFIQAYDAYINEDIEQAGQTLEKIDIKKLTGTVKTFYTGFSEMVNQEYLKILYQEGEKNYKSYRYQEAIEKLKKVVDLQEDYEDGYAVYYLAQSYRKVEDVENALVYYQKVAELKPGTERARVAEAFISEQTETEETE